MDARTILDQLLASGKELVSQGREIAEDQLGFPDESNQRSAMLSGLGKGAAMGGVLALLLGTGRGRRLTGTAIKLGSLAAVGGIAYKSYQKWQQANSSATDFGTSIVDLTDLDASQRSLSLMKAMIAAAKADGHLDPTEVANIRQQLANLELDDEFAGLVDAELERPLDAKEIADLADSPAAAAEIYLTSLMVIDVDTPQERRYLDDLVSHLGLPQQYVAELEAETAI